jgi:glucosylceramidase
MYSYDDSTEPDPDLKKFNIDHDRKYILPMLREAMAVNRDMFFFASPWSPPGWMKPNGTMLGGNMQRKYMPAYAQYFRKFIEAYDTAHVPIKAVTVQNEVDTDQDSRMPACSWPQEYEVDFVRKELGPSLRAAKLDTDIWMIDHNYNMWGRALASLEEPEIKDYVHGIAWHGYVGDPAKMAEVHKLNPTVQMHWTEGGPDITDPEYQTAWTKWSTTFSEILRNWCTSITVWNLALDEEGKPNIGPFPCGGLVTVNSKTGELTYSGQYYALAHLSKFIRPGAARIASTAAIPDTGGGESHPEQFVAHVAFVNPDGSTVLVLTNPTSLEIVSQIALNDHGTLVHLPPDSVTTLVMK